MGAGADERESQRRSAPPIPISRGNKWRVKTQNWLKRGKEEEYCPVVTKRKRIKAMSNYSSVEGLEWSAQFARKEKREDKNPGWFPGLRKNRKRRRANGGPRFSKEVEGLTTKRGRAQGCKRKMTKRQ